ncbi:hypothetical protein T03_12954 [Trichinella britovi]|uniref:Peptidase A2 domain-containing protein n=1 Tax=Trichinella britovi TaxID=45882 RepID=A0A0V1B3F0_TRIBR|nr:hypothetical protein T03_12954 [Trichinella britovi]
MKQYFDEGWAEPAPEASPRGRTWYLPHHAVYQGAGSERKCRVVLDGCRQLHHKLFHPSPMTESARSSGSDRTHPSLWAVRSTSGKGLQTIRARAYGPEGNQVVVNCLFDTGSQVSLIWKDVAEVLGLTGSHERCRFTTLGGRVGPLGAVESSGRPLTSTLIRALAIPRYRASADGAPAGTKPEMGQRRETPLMIDVLIGIDYYYE